MINSGYVQTSYAYLNRTKIYFRTKMEKISKMRLKINRMCSFVYMQYFSAQ